MNANEYGAFLTRRGEVAQELVEKQWKENMNKPIEKSNKAMTKKEYTEFHKAMCDKMVEITKAKNADYTGSGDDPFANFKMAEAYGCVSTEQGFFTRISDKLSRISSYIQKGELLVKDESVEDTLLDLANYAILFRGYLESKKRENQ